MLFGAFVVVADIVLIPTGLALIVVKYFQPTPPYSTWPDIYVFVPWIVAAVLSLLAHATGFWKDVCCAPCRSRP